MDSYSVSTAAVMGGPRVAAPAVWTPRKSDQSGIIVPGRNTAMFGPGHARFHAEKTHGESSKWNVVAIRSDWPNADIDWYRAKYGKEAGEFRFYLENPEPETVDIHIGNMVMAKGVAALWQCAGGNGTSTANSALPAPTYLTTANAYLGVGDGGIAAGTGTVSVTNGSAAATFSTTQTTIQGKYVVVTGDSTNGFYLDLSATGTAHTLGSNYGGSTNASAAWSYLNAESHAQTGLQGSTNTYLQAVDSGFPTNPYSAQLNAITAATNASPIVLTVSGADINTNDIVIVEEVYGNTGANGIFVANPASGSSITLLNSSGNAAYLFGGIVTKAQVITAQATFGSTSAEFAWNEWCLYNGNGSNKIAWNRKVANLGVKGSGTTALKVGIGIG